MWKREVVNGDTVAAEDARPQFVIDDEDDEEGEGEDKGREQRGIWGKITRVKE